MHTEVTQSRRKSKNNKSPTSRGNFSQSGKLFDQTFYIESGDTNFLYKKVEFECSPRKSPRQATTAFTSVSRDIRPNIRFSSPVGEGEFRHKPNHFYGRNKSPSWSFPKKQRYGNEKVQQYEICSKHPIAKEDKEEKLHNSTTSIKESLYSKRHLKKSASFNETADGSRNYSIVLPRRTSFVDFFSKTKIKNALYLTKQQIMNEQQRLEGGRSLKLPAKGYIEFFKKRPRQSLKVSKGFEIFLPSYSHEKQFSNFELTKFPTSPQYNMSFDRQMDRNFEARQTYGPNLQFVKIDATRAKRNNIGLNTSKFISKIRTRFQTNQPPASIRLDYDVAVSKLGGMITMDRMKGRSSELFPIVDSAIKKAGDSEALENLRQIIPIKQINEAMNPMSYSIKI